MSQSNPWDQGDYAALAGKLQPAAAALAAAAGPGRSRRALDIAAGTGSVALCLAERGWQVTATDGAEQMVARGQAGTAAAGHDVEWAVADLADQPVDAGSIDLVASSFGMIFAPDVPALMAEVARVLRSDGELVLTAWPEGGYIDGMARAMAPFLPPVEGRPNNPWGSAAFLRETLAPVFAEVDIVEVSLPWAFPSAARGRAWLERVSPAHIAAKAVAGEQAEAMMDAVEEFLARYADATGRVYVDAAYLVVHARRRGGSEAEAAAPL
ncbi:methyltransferase domain-containing protein [Nocardioides limicola]|uniref:methyltransferase domain-containing protein n=1 Tax=Nocardioides limicola TaxID=2803368 RepID=UPI00193C1DE2|nr:methyltransferase domain-containing protein [Nocardioides sp. DJM-14]